MEFNRRTGSFLILALLLAVAGAGCGRKAMPAVPGFPIPARVADLQAERTADAVRLSWSVAADSQGAVINAFRVFRARQELSGGACPTCPPEFHPVGRAAPENREGKLWGQYSEPLEKGYRYTYYVTGYSNNMAGPPSNQVVIVYE